MRLPLPNAHLAIVDHRKIRDYLLSTSHPIGRFKARTFRSLGYTAERWDLLRAELRGHAAEGIVTGIRETRFGRVYEVSGMLRGPTGRAGMFTTVWIIARCADRPRLVTAFPR